jgi:hypothetical protein
MMKGDIQVFLMSYVLRYLSVNLWRRDVLQGMGAILGSPNGVVSHILQQGFDLCRGLGKVKQGRLYPIDSDTHSVHTGLGFSLNQPFQEGPW